MNIIDKLRTPIATLIVLCAALLAQLPHAADVFRIIVHADGWLAVAHGYAYAIALELAVLLFVVQRRNVESYIFAVVSVLVNLSYYALHGVALLSIAALPAWLVSIALPAAIARYSHLLVDEPHTPAADAPTAPAKRSAAQKGTPDTTKNDATPHSARSVGTLTPSGVAPEPAENPQTDTPDAPARMAPEQRRQHIAELQLQKAEQVMQMFNVGKRTADADLSYVRKHMQHTNGVQL